MRHISDKLHRTVILSVKFLFNLRRLMYGKSRSVFESAI